MPFQAAPLLFHVRGKATSLKYLRLGNLYLGSAVCSIFMNPGFSMVYMGTMSLAIWNATASVISFHRGAFLSYGTELENDTANEIWRFAILGGPFALGLSLFSSLNFEHSSHSAWCLCRKCWNKLVVLPLPVETDFLHILHLTKVCSTSELSRRAVHLYDIISVAYYVPS